MMNPRAKGRRNATTSFEIMDTTLRDGEQTEGVSILPEEKLAIAHTLIESLNVDRIEVASARVSAGELESVRAICDWARKHKVLDRIEILGFVDHKASVDWSLQAGCRVINLLTKGSRDHCEKQLGRTLDEHLADIRKTVRYGHGKDVTFNVYLEDWSGGMLRSPEYVMEMTAALIEMGFARIMLPDTLGLFEPTQVRAMVGRMVEEFPGAHFDFHAHNDYGLATANTLEGLRAGARGVHVTINGLGERTGNARLDEVVVAANDFTDFRCKVDEKRLHEASRLTEIFTGKRLAWNKPITGENVFTQTAGIHADGDKKANLYESRLTPARFGRARSYAMGKLMGKASLDLNLKKLGLELSREQKQQLMDRIVELAEAKKVITAEDLPFIISDVLLEPAACVFEVIDFMIVSNNGLKPAASVLVRYADQTWQATASGSGGYDAFMAALRTLEKDLPFKIPRLLDYEVRIPPGGKTDALVETTITWEGGVKTRGVNSDQLVAAIEATTRAINIVAMRAGEAREAPAAAKA